MGNLFPMCEPKFTIMESFYIGQTRKNSHEGTKTQRIFIIIFS